MAKILIAEDDASMRDFLAMALGRAGHIALTAKDGLEAAHILKQGKEFDLLLTDIVMPGMDGIELSRVARKEYPALKIMFITGFAAIAMNTGTDLPVDGPVLSKPFHLSTLIEQIEKVLHSS